MILGSVSRRTRGGSLAQALLLGGGLLLAGCQASRPPAPTAAFSPASSTGPADSPEANEGFDAETGARLPARVAGPPDPILERPRRSALPPPEPVAIAIVTAIRGSIEKPPSHTNVGLETLQNRSRSTAGEFDRFRRRLAALLTSAGVDSGMMFTAGPAGVNAPYQLGGTAYLVTAHGFDQWEVYLRLTDAETKWNVWQSGGPVRLMRQPRPGEPEFTAGP